MVDALFAGCLAMLLTFAAGHPVLNELRRRKMGKSYTGDEPEAYEKKAGTPVGGGIMFLIGGLIASSYLRRPLRRGHPDPDARR